MKLYRYLHSGEFDAEFDGYKEASKNTYVTVHTISSCINGYSRSAGGYQWLRIKLDKIPAYVKHQGLRRKKLCIYAYNKKTKESLFFNSIDEAVDYFGVVRSSILYSAKHGILRDGFSMYVMDGGKKK